MKIRFKKKLTGKLNKTFFFVSERADLTIRLFTYTRIKSMK